MVAPVVGDFVQGNTDWFSSLSIRPCGYDGIYRIATSQCNSAFMKPIEKEEDDNDDDNKDNEDAEDVENDETNEDKVDNKDEEKEDDDKDYKDD